MMPAPVTVRENATSNCTAMKAPEDRPETLTWPAFIAGSDTTCAGAAPHSNTSSRNIQRMATSLGIHDDSAGGAGLFNYRQSCARNDFFGVFGKFAGIGIE
jgi:hypothetical protein